MLKMKACHHLTPGSGSKDFIIGLTFENATDTKGVGNNKRLTEAVGIKAAGVTAPLLNAVPRKGQGTDTASPAKGRVAVAVRDGMDPILTCVMVNDVAGGVMNAWVALDRLSPNFP